MGSYNVEPGAVIKIAAGEIGTVEDPAGSNLQKYGEWWGWNGVSWCMQFVQWCFAQCGAPMPVKSASCSEVRYWYMENIPERVKTEPAPGYVAIYDGHCGIVESVPGGGYMYCIEGNTSPTDKGNQSNGGGVWRKKRKISKAVCFIDVLGGDEEVTQEQFDKMMDNYLERKFGKTVPAWAKREYAEAVKAGITDGDNGTALTPRYQAAIMALRAKK